MTSPQQADQLTDQQWTDLAIQAFTRELQTSGRLMALDDMAESYNMELADLVARVDVGQLRAAVVQEQERLKELPPLSDQARRRIQARRRNR